MREKINLQELTALLSDKAGITKKDADAFLREFFGLMTESLVDDKSVKIRNLGTFKLTEVDARESVNVRTGERFLIAAHSRVSFSPDKTLSEIINKPYEHLVPENIPTPVKIVPAEKTVPVKNVSVNKNVPVDDDVPAILSEPFYKEIENPESNLPARQNYHADFDSYDRYDYDKLGADTIRKRRNQIITVILTFLVVGALIAFFYYYARESTVKRPSSPRPNKENTEKNDSDISNNTDTTAIVSPKDTIPLLKENVWAQGKKRKTKVGERLTLIAYEEFGDVVFWIYIYEENKHLISKDNFVNPGIELTIPPPEKYDIDATSAKSIQRARDFAKKLENKKNG
ncbi:MAG: HU family DNA-binding protein [Dysgonamonadaceae bacterium]|jgi:nucleoid DNA-binding protein|nr:HU family DNA-binding protein [Dysgonamonadaceae bacterium]